MLYFVSFNKVFINIAMIFFSSEVIVNLQIYCLFCFVFFLINTHHMDTSFDLLYFAFCASFTFPSLSLACLFAYLMVFLFCCRCCVDIHQTLLTKTVFIWNLYVIQRFPACVCSVLLLLSLRFCMFACVFIPRLFCFVSIKASFVDQLFFCFVCLWLCLCVCFNCLFLFLLFRTYHIKCFAHWQM